MRLDHLLSRERARKRKRKRRRPEVERGGGVRPRSERRKASESEPERRRAPQDRAETLQKTCIVFRDRLKRTLKTAQRREAKKGKKKFESTQGRGERLWRGGATRNWGKSRPVRETRSQDRGERSSKKGHREDAKAPSAEEGRGKLREATRSRKRALIRGYPNGGTRRG